VLPRAVSALPVPVTLRRFVFLAGLERADRAASPSCGATSFAAAARVYNRPKNLSSIARRADSRVTQAACMVIDIDP
jgi:hypothetical protein